MTNFLIYGLFDPRNDEAFYVGRSSSGLSRGRRHWCSERELRKDDACHARIRGMLGEDVTPEVVVLEEVPGGPDVDLRLALSETRWMSEMRARGHGLLNVGSFGNLGGNGRRLSSQHRRNIRKALKGRRWKKSNPNHFIGALPLKTPVYNLEHDLVFLSVEDAANHFRIPQGNVSKAARGVRSCAGGLTFEQVSIIGLDLPRPTKRKRGRKRKTAGKLYR